MGVPTGSWKFRSGAQRRGESSGNDNMGIVQHEDGCGDGEVGLVGLPGALKGVK